MSQTPGSIDYSPHPDVRNHTLVLQNEELLTTKPHQFERFFRVWFTDVSMYAPCLTELTLILRPSCVDSNTIDIQGIQRLLNYVQFYLSGKKSQTKLILQQDKYATVNDNRVLEVENEYKTIAIL